jgi:hypothetical protein
MRTGAGWVIKGVEVKPARIAAALAAALAGVLLASPARAENDYEHAQDLIELRWYDVAERLIKKIPDKAEATLGMACLAKGRGDANADLLQRRKLYREALAQIAEYKKAASKDHPLQTECLSLEATVQQGLAKVGNDIYRDRKNLKISEDELKDILAEIKRATEDAGKNLMAGVTAAENAYAGALKDYRDSSKVGDKWEELKRKAFNAYGEAAQNYLRVLLNNADKLDPNSAEQKAEGEKVTKFVLDWNKKQSEKYLESISEMDDRPVPEYAGMWIYMKFALGRGLSLTGRAEDGSKEFEKVINGIEVTDFGEGLPRQFATHYKTKCIYYRARAWADKALSSKSDAHWQNALQSSWHEIFANNPGTDPIVLHKSRILKGEAAARMGRMKDAMEDLNRALDDISKAEQDNQANPQKGLRPESCQALRFETYQVLADVVNDLLQRGDTVPQAVPPEAFVQAGYVNYRQEKYPEAIGCFRGAAMRARMSDMVDKWDKRLVIDGEPKAWYFMGNAYHRMGNEIEAQLAYEGALLTFWGETGTALPEKFRKDNTALLERLKAEVLGPCAQNGRIAAAAEQQSSPSKFNTDQALRWIRWQAKLTPGGESDEDFLTAQLTYQNACLQVDEFRGLERSNRLVDALRKKTEALQGFADADTAFMKTPDKSSSREEGLYWAGMCCYQTMSLMSGRRQTEKQTEGEKKAADEYAERSLKRFADYRAFIKENPPKPQSADPGAREAQKKEILDRRGRHEASIDLIVPFIFIDRKKYADALAAGEKLRGREGLDASQQEGLHQISFKCFIELALEEKDVAKTKGLLEKAEKEAEWFKAQIDKASGEDQEKRKRLYYSLAGRLGFAYDDAYKKAYNEKNEKEARAMTELKGKWYKVVLQDPANQTIDGLGRTAKVFFDLGSYADARELYEKLLSKDFDTRGDRTRVPDKELISFDTLKAAVKGVDFPSVVIMVLAKEKLEAIKLAVFGGTKELKDPDGEIVKTEIPKDYDRALGLIGRFLDEYKSYDTVEGKAGNARKGIEALREELEFRLKMLRASNEITTCYMAQGKQLIDEKKADEAKEVFKKGLANATKALNLWPRDAELIFNKAYCQLAAGEVEDAVKTLAELRRPGGIRYGSELWWRVTQAYGQCLIVLGKHEEARGLLVQIILNTNPEVLKYSWPDIRETAIGLAEKMFPGTAGEAALAKLLGETVKLPDFDYTPKSELEKAVGRSLASLQIDLKNGKINEAEAKFREEVLKELVQISKDRPAILRTTKEPTESVVIMIHNGRVRSLKNLGGFSRGEANDKDVPELKPEQPKTPEKAPEKAPSKDGALRPGCARPLAAVLGMEGGA